MTVKIEKYGNRNHAVWLVGGPDGDELVAVCVYKKGAAVVGQLVEELIKMKGGE